MRSEDVPLDGWIWQEIGRGSCTAWIAFVGYQNHSLQNHSSLLVGCSPSHALVEKKSAAHLHCIKGSDQWEDLGVESKPKRKVMVWGPGAEQWILFVIYRDAILDSISFIFLSLKQKMLELDLIVGVANCKQRWLFFVFLSCGAY